MNKFLFLSLSILFSCSGKLSNPIADNNSNEELTGHSFIWQDRERSYWVHLPPKSKMDGPVPLLFHLHGGGGTGKTTPNLTFKGFIKIADKEGFIVVYPDGLGRLWNDGRPDVLKPKNRDADDVGFILEIINVLQKKHDIDPNKIFTTGMSNGGFMSTRLLCEHADVFRGGAIVISTISEEYFPKCNPSQPVGVLVMNGTDDPLVPYGGGDIRIVSDGGSRGKILSTDDYLDFWVSENGCDKKPVTIDLPNKKPLDGTTVSISTYNDCSGNGALKFYKINGGGHTWPGGKQYLGKKTIGNTSREINACNEIWDFFSSLD